MSATPAGPSLQLTRRFDAAPARVFDAWTDPSVLRRWWASLPEWEGADAEVDLREGGRYRLAMRDPDTGDVHAVTGEFVEVAPPSRLAYTWTWEGRPALMAGSEGTLVVVDFVPDGTGTEVRLAHAGFAGAQIRDMHVDGWEGCLTNLSRRVLAPRDRTDPGGTTT